MACEAQRLVREREAAELQGNLRLEAVCVEPNPAAGRARRRRLWLEGPDCPFPQDGTQDHEVAILGQLSVGGIPRDGANRNANRGQCGGLIGRLTAPHPSRVEGRQQYAQARRLGSLSGTEPLSGDRCLDKAIVNPLERVSHRQHGDGRTAVPCRTDHRFDQRRAHRGPCGIVHEHDRAAGDAAIGQCHEPSLHRGRANLAALDQETSVCRSLRHHRAEALDLAGRHHQRHARQFRNGEQRIQAPAPDGPPPQLDPQLVAAHTTTASGRDHHAGELAHRLRVVSCVRGDPCSDGVRLQRAPSRGRAPAWEWARFRPESHPAAARRSCDQPPSATRGSR